MSSHRGRGVSENIPNHVAQLMATQQQQQQQHHSLDGGETEDRLWFPEADKMEIQRQPRESKRKRFKPWENLRRMFQRKNPAITDHEATTSKGRSSSSSRLSGVFGLASSASRSRSTSELLTTEPQPIPVVSASTSNSRATVGASSLGAGLSVSHDSVFGLDTTPESDVYSPQSRGQTTAAESLPSSASLQYMSELRAAIGVRHRSAEDDEGLPRSPVNATPTTAQVLFVDSSIHNNVVHGGGGSDPSLLSINSCELDEAPFVSLQHGRTQQEPQQEPQPQQQPGKVLQRAGSNKESMADGSRLDASLVDDGLSVAMAASLNHSAARHKMAIRPKRNHVPARPRQLPQLAEGAMEEDLAWSNHPSGEDDQPSVPERKNRMGRLLRAEPVTPSGSSHTYTKPRSVSLSRTEDCAIREAPIPVNDPESSNNVKPSAGSSSVKLARSKSSVEKKIQHEVAVFWRRTKEGRLFQRKESPEKEAPANNHQDGSIPPETEIKRKDLRKIKRDKEEKRKRSDASANKEDSSPPFLSRIFGSRRSGRRQRKKTPVPPSPEERRQTPSPLVPSDPVPVPKPRTVFTHHNPVDDLEDEEMEIDWKIPHQAYSYAPPPPPPVRPVPPQLRLAEKWSETDHFVKPPPMTSPKLGRTEEFSSKSSPLPSRHHRIHIAGLSPYQRRVARIGNGLEISDDEWDQPEPAISPTRSYHFRPEGRDRSDLSLNLENKSLPATINHDFILKKASPAQSPTTPVANDSQLRRSFEILKYSNEGLKKTIDSLNPKRMSQSSDQLHLSDGSGQRESSGSVSNSTSSLNISDADDTIDTNGSMISLIQSADDEKDVRDDVLIVDDHKETIQSSWQKDVESSVESESNADHSPPSSHPGIAELIQLNRRVPVNETTKPPSPEEPVKPKHKSWENRQMAGHPNPQDPPMFSMSVRVQNPPDVKFKRSMSTPTGETSLTVQQQQQQQQTAPEVPPVRKLSDAFHQPRPFIMSVRMGTDGDGVHPQALPAQQLMAKLSARPWQSKEEKDRQNKVALSRSQQELVAEPEPVGLSNNKLPPLPPPPPSVEWSKPEETEIVAAAAASPEVKLRPKKPALEETSELLKVFARRSLKVRDSRDLTDVNNFSITLTEQQIQPQVGNEGSNAVSSSSLSPNNSSRPLQQQQQQDDPTLAAEVGQSTEKSDLSKEKMPLKKGAKPPVAIRSTTCSSLIAGQDERSFDPSADRVLKSSGRPPPFFRAGLEPSSLLENTVPTSRSLGPLFIRLTADDKSGDPAADQNLKSLIPISTSPSAAEKNMEASSDTNRISDSSALPVTTPDESVWKRHQPNKPPRPAERLNSGHKFSTKTIDEEVKAATAVPPVRQSKVLDMVNNFQRLQVT